MSRSSDHHQRRSLAPSLARLLRLLSQLTPASGIGEELANSTRGRSAGEGQGHLNSASRRAASLLPTSRLTMAIRLISIEPTEGLQALAEIAARCSIVMRHQSEIESSIRRKIGAASSENLVLIHKTEFSIRTRGCSWSRRQSKALICSK